MTLNSKVEIPNTVFIQNIGDESILLDTNTQEYFALNEIGKVILELLIETQSLKKTYEKMINVYDIEENLLRNDILNFISSLEEKGLVKVS